MTRLSSTQKASRAGKRFDHSQEQSDEEEEQRDIDKSDEEEWEAQTELQIGLKSLEFEAAEAVGQRSKELLQENVSKWESSR